MKEPKEERRRIYHVILLPRFGFSSSDYPSSVLTRQHDWRFVLRRDLESLLLTAYLTTTNTLECDVTLYFQFFYTSTTLAIPQKFIRNGIHNPKHLPILPPFFGSSLMNIFPQMIKIKIHISPTYSRRHMESDPILLHSRHTMQRATPSTLPCLPLRINEHNHSLRRRPMKYSPAVKLTATSRKCAPSPYHGTRTLAIKC